MEDKNQDIEINEFMIEGRNAVTEAFRSGKVIDKVYILDGCQDGAINTIKREAKKRNAMVKYVTRQRLDQKTSGGYGSGGSLLLCTGRGHACPGKAKGGAAFFDPFG